jgi:hypothetical protein
VKTKEQSPLEHKIKQDNFMTIFHKNRLVLNKYYYDTKELFCRTSRVWSIRAYVEGPLLGEFVGLFVFGAFGLDGDGGAGESVVLLGDFVGVLVFTAAFGLEVAGESVVLLGDFVGLFVFGAFGMNVIDVGPVGAFVGLEVIAVGPIGDFVGLVVGGMVSVGALVGLLMVGAFVGDFAGVATGDFVCEAVGSLVGFALVGASVKAEAARQEMENVRFDLFCIKLK